MKLKILSCILLSALCAAQQNSLDKKITQKHYVKNIPHLTLDAAVELANRLTVKANSMDNEIAIAILDTSGSVLLLMRGDGVGPHNTEAARRKAYTALSTKMPTLQLLRNAALIPDTQNLNTLPELLLLSGGRPLWYKSEIIGSVGVAGGGSPENDDVLARAAEIPGRGIMTTK